MRGHLGNPTYEILKCILAALEKKDAPQVRTIVMCDDETNTQWVKVFTYEWEPVTAQFDEKILSFTDTGVACDLEPPVVTILPLEVCDPVTKTLHMQSWSYITVYDNEDVDDSEPTTLPGTMIGDIDTGIPCGCDPAIVDLTADDLSTAILFNSIGISKPECCEVTIETSVGTFTIPKGKLGIDLNDFSCPIELLGVTVAGDCTLEQIHMILQRQ